MLVQHFIKNIFQSGLTLISSNDILTIKIHIKKMFQTHKKNNKRKQKSFFQKKLAVKSKKGNELGS